MRHVATNHGGDVQVSSEEGEGSTFVFRLPASLIVPVDPPAARDTDGDDGPNHTPAKTEMSE